MTEPSRPVLRWHGGKWLLAPWIILTPGLVLAATVLAINLMGDGLRDMLDPRFAKPF